MKLTDVNRIDIKKNGLVRHFLKNIEFWLLCLPAIIYFIVFKYWPMFGAMIAFKDFNYTAGIFGSEWVGFDNFKFFFLSNDAWRITRNTIGYAIVGIIFSNAAGIAIALMLFEIRKRFFIKTYQTIMILPHFMSWVIIGYITHVFFSSEFGVLNKIITSLGGSPIAWYSTPEVWPFILPVVHVWKGLGMGSIMYYAALMGVDASIYEAAVIDGAGKWRQTFSISIPCLVPMITILLIMSIGTVLHSDFGLFYQIPRDIPLLYPTTDVIDTYIYRGLRTGDVGMTAAVGLFQSVVGFTLVMLSNYIVKKVEPDNAMF